MPGLAQRKGSPLNIAGVWFRSRRGGITKDEEPPQITGRTPGLNAENWVRDCCFRIPAVTVRLGSPSWIVIGLAGSTTLAGGQKADGDSTLQLDCSAGGAGGAAVKLGRNRNTEPVEAMAEEVAQGVQLCGMLWE
eukprot:g8309.t1